MTKSYLFAALTSTLLLVLVVPLLKDSWWMPTELVSIAVLSVISIAVGGLSAEIYVIVRGRKAATDLSGTNTRKYFMSLISSLLFLTIVAPSIQSMIDSASVVDAATIAFLLILSLALAGLTAQGFFAILSQKATRKNVDCKNVLGATPDASVDSSSKSLGSSSQVGAEIDSRFNAIDATLDKRSQYECALSSQDRTSEASTGYSYERSGCGRPAWQSEGEWNLTCKQQHLDCSGETHHRKPRSPIRHLEIIVDP